MYVLVLHSGSSSFKLRLVDTADAREGARAESVRTLMAGSVQGIGGRGNVDCTRNGALSEAGRVRLQILTLSLKKSAPCVEK
jgi:hypothetical protein